MTAQVLVGFPVTRGLTRKQIAYTVEADIKDFAVERMVRGQKLEASTLRKCIDVSKGKAPKMPAYGEKLKPEEIKDLVAYIRTLAK